MKVRFLSAGDRALVVEFGERIDRALSDDVLQLDARLRSRPLPGVVETVPTFRSLMVHYDPLVTTRDALERAIANLLDREVRPRSAGTLWRVPVCYDGEFAPDLAEVARLTGLSPGEVVALHSGTLYHVYMLGFLPGFPYMGDLPARLALPRRADPRIRVPAGSIAIATNLTAIYPFESPGGWHLIGATPIRLFDPARAQPALLAPGDAVQMRADGCGGVRVDQAGGPRRHLPDRERANRWMTAGLKVLTPGLHTTVQDLGRPGYLAIGVPISGALDGFSLRLANALVGNSSGSPALEILLSGPTFEVAADTVRVALAGPGASLAVGADRPRVIAAGQSVTLPRGEVFEIVAGGQSACCYLAVEGGIAAPPVLGSASTYVRAAIGGIEGRALQHGDFVPLAVCRASERPELRLPPLLPASGDRPIRVVLGPQQEYFTEDAIAALLDGEFRISQNADRMGMRLARPACCGTAMAGTSSPTRSRRVPSRCQVRDSRSCCLPTTRRRADTRRSPRSSRPICRSSAAAGRATRCALSPCRSKRPRQLCRDAERQLTELVARLEPICGSPRGSTSNRSTPEI